MSKKKVEVKNLEITINYGYNFDDDIYKMNLHLPMEIRLILNFFMVGERPEVSFNFNSTTRFRYKIRTLMQSYIGNLSSDFRHYFWDLFQDKEAVDYIWTFQNTQYCQHIVSKLEEFIRRASEMFSELNVEYNITYELLLGDDNA